MTSDEFDISVCSTVAYILVASYILLTYSSVLSSSIVYIRLVCMITSSSTVVDLDVLDTNMVSKIKTFTFGFSIIYKL